MSLLGPLLRLLGRLDPREAAAYEEAAREAFKAGTPTDVRTTSPPIDAVDFGGSSDAAPLGPFALPARRQGPATGKPPASLGTQPTAKLHESDRATAKEPAIEHRLPDPDSRGAVDSTDLLRASRSVTPVADDFFDGLIRRVEGKR